MNEKSIISPNSEIKKRRLENEKDHHVTMEQQWEADVRPIADVEMNTVGVFKYKLVNELSFPLQPFRTATANRQWYRIKNELEIKFHLSKAKQEKKSLVHSAFLAFHLSDWEKMEQRSDMYNVTKTSALEAHYEVKPDDVLVIARLPTKVVKGVYVILVIWPWRYI